MCNTSDRPLREPSSVSILSGNSAQQIFTEQLLSLGAGPGGGDVQRALARGTVASSPGTC